MPIVVRSGPYTIGSIIALVVLILAIVFLVIGHVTPFVLLVFIAALALAMLV